MENKDWLKEFNAGVTIADENGIIVYMNDKSVEIFKNDGGEKLVGENVLECHPEPARTKLDEMMKNRSINAYTIEKNGKKKLIYQSPRYEGGIYKGFVELSIEIPFDLPHFIRK